MTDLGQSTTLEYDNLNDEYFFIISNLYVATYYEIDFRILFVSDSTGQNNIQWEVGNISTPIIQGFDKQPTITNIENESVEFTFNIIDPNNFGYKLFLYNYDTGNEIDITDQIVIIDSSTMQYIWLGEQGTGLTRDTNYNVELILKDTRFPEQDGTLVILERYQFAFKTTYYFNDKQEAEANITLDFSNVNIQMANTKEDIIVDQIVVIFSNNFTSEEITGVWLTINPTSPSGAVRAQVVRNPSSFNVYTISFGGPGSAPLQYGRTYEGMYIQYKSGGQDDELTINLATGEGINNFIDLQTIKIGEETFVVSAEDYSLIYNDIKNESASLSINYIGSNVITPNIREVRIKYVDDSSSYILSLSQGNTPTQEIKDLVNNTINDIYIDSSSNNWNYNEALKQLNLNINGLYLGSQYDVYLVVDSDYEGAQQTEIKLTNNNPTNDSNLPTNIPRLITTNYFITSPQDYTDPFNRPQSSLDTDTVRGNNVNPDDQSCSQSGIYDCKPNIATYDDEKQNHIKQLRYTIDYYLYQDTYNEGFKVYIYDSTNSKWIEGTYFIENPSSYNSTLSMNFGQEFSPDPNSSDDRITYLSTYSFLRIEYIFNSNGDRNIVDFPIVPEIQMGDIKPNNSISDFNSSITNLTSTSFLLERNLKPNPTCCDWKNSYC